MAVGSHCNGTCENGYEGSPQGTVPEATCGATGFTVTGECVRSEFNHCCLHWLLSSLELV